MCARLVTFVVALAVAGCGSSGPPRDVRFCDAAAEVEALGGRSAHDGAVLLAARLRTLSEVASPDVQEDIEVILDSLEAIDEAEGYEARQEAFGRLDDDVAAATSELVSTVEGRCPTVELGWDV